MVLGVHTWVAGEIVSVEAIDAIQAARDLAAFVAALQQVDPEGAPPGRGISLAERGQGVRYWLARFEGKSQGRPNEKPGLEAHRSITAYPSAFSQTSPVPDQPTVRSAPDETSKEQFHASRSG